MATSSENNNQNSEHAIDLTELYKGSRIKYFLTIFRARMGLLAKINILLALFATPTIAIALIFGAARNTIFNGQPFSSNLGIGFPVITDAATRASYYMFLQNLYIFIGVAASIPVLLIGMCGAFYTVKFVAKGQNVPVMRTFLIGIKKCFLPFLIISPIIAGLVFAISAGSVGFNHFWLDRAGLKIALLIIACSLALALSFMLVFYCTLGVTYKLNPWQVLRNSAKMAFTPRIMWRTLIMLALTAGPIIGGIFLLRVPFGIVFVAIPAAIIVFALFMLMWTIYADWVFKNAVAPTTTGKKVAAQKVVEIKKSDIVEVSADENNDTAAEIIEDTEEENIEEEIAQEPQSAEVEIEATETDIQKADKLAPKQQTNKKYSFKKK